MPEDEQLVELKEEELRSERQELTELQDEELREEQSRSWRCSSLRPQKRRG